MSLKDFCKTICWSLLDFDIKYKGSLFQAENGYACQQSCENDPTGYCNYFTWFDGGMYEGTCFHFSICNTHDTSCRYCYSGGWGDFVHLCMNRMSIKNNNEYRLNSSFNHFKHFRSQAKSLPFQSMAEIS